MKRLSFFGSGRVSVCALLLACVLLIMVASASYPMFHYDVQRTGNVSGDAPMTNDRLWSTDLGGFVDSSPIVSDGRVYASNWEMGVGDYGLYCLDEQTGTTIWKNLLNGGEGSASTAAISGDKIFVGSKNGHIYCINASSGETIWNKRIEHSPAWWGVASSPLVYENENMVFVTTFSNNASNNGTLHVLDFNGSELWSISTGDIFYYTSPAIAEGNVFFAGNLTNHTLYCVNISTHNILWLFNTSTQIKSTPAIWNNTVFFASEDRMYTIDVYSGEEIWNNSFSCVMSSPAVSNGKVYIGSSDKKMYCYDGLTGVELWNCSVDGVIQSSPVIANDTVFFGTSVFGAVADGTVYALNTTDGLIIWSYCINQCVMSSPAVSDGILFIGADDGRVYAFGEKPAITSKIRIEGKNETIWSGEVTFSNSTIVDTNGTLYHIFYPSTVGALDEASKKGNFSYEVIYNPTYDALHVKSIANESDWWHYWVNYTLPSVGVDKYEIKEGDYVLWGYSESWTPSPLKMSLGKDIVKINETFNVTVFNVSANITTPLENATVYVDSLNYSTNEEGNATISLGEVGLYEVYAEKDGYIRSEKEEIQVLSNIATINVRIEGQNATIWSGKVTFSNSTIVDTDNVSHYLDKPTALGVVDAASKLGNFSYGVENQTWGLFLKSISGEAYDPTTWDGWMYRVDYYSPTIGAAGFVINVTEPPPTPHREILWYYGSWTMDPLNVTLDKTCVSASEPFNATVKYYNDTTSGWDTLDNATVHIGTLNYTTGSEGNVTISLSSAGTYKVYAEKDGFVRSRKRNVSVFLPHINVRIEGKNETIWNGEVTFGNSTIVDTDNVSHYLDMPTALGAVDMASKHGNFSYEVENQTWGLFLKSISGEAYDPATWDGWMYRVDYYSPTIGAAGFVINVTEPPSVPHDEVLWYYGSWTDAPLKITLDKTSVKVNEQFTATVESYNDTSGLWDLLDNATVYVDSSNSTTDINGSVVISISSVGSYTTYAEKEGYIRSEKKTVTVTPTDGGDDENLYWWDGRVSLPSGTFTKTAFNTGKTYTINWSTALGALEAASRKGGFDYKIEETTWGPFVYSIGDKKKYNEGETSGWMYQVNGEIPIVGAHEYSVNVGNEIIWYFSKSMDTTPSTSSMVLRIRIVSPSSDSSSGGSGGISPSSTPTPMPVQIVEETKIIEAIEAGENASVTFEKTDITRIIINANNTIRNAEVTIQQIEKTANITNVSGIHYRYFNITTANLTATDITNATIEFKVNKTWINENDIDETTITLNRYSNITGNWCALPTTKIEEDNTSLYFESETQGFSLFAISGEKKAASLAAETEIPMPEVTVTPTPTTSSPTSSVTPQQKTSLKGKWEIVMGSIIIAVIIGFVSFYMYYRKKRRKG